MIDFLEILNEPEACQIFLRWLFDGDEFKDAGLNFDDIETDWPTFWKSIDKVFPHTKSRVKETLKKASVVLVNKVVDRLHFSFSSKAKSKAGQIFIARTLFYLSFDKNLKGEAELRG